MDRDSDGSMTICFVRIEDLQWGLRQVDVDHRQIRGPAGRPVQLQPGLGPDQYVAGHLQRRQGPDAA